MGQTFTVSTIDALYAALGAATAGDRIELEAGNYGELYLRSAKFGGEGITITSADPDNMAVFDKIHLPRSADMHFDRIEIDFEPVGNTGYSSGFRVTDGANISLTNSLIHGGFDPDRDPKYADAPIGVGVQIRHTDNVNISGNEIFDFHAGIGVGNIDGLTVNDNYVHDLRTTPLGGGALNDVEVIGNRFESSRPIDLGGNGDHGNMIHFYPLSAQDGPMRNIIIRDNFMKQGTNPDALVGIHIDDTGSGGADLGYVNVVIENNILHNGDAQGIRAENVDGLSILNNSFVQSTGHQGNAPGIILTRGTENVTIDSNIIAGLIGGDSVRDAGANVTIGDNIFIQNRDPLGENYAGDLFVNGLAPNADPHDLIALEGAAAAGYGADFSRFDLSDDLYVAVLSDMRGEGLDVKTIAFEALGLFTTAGDVDLNGATVDWDFGDGTTGTGMAASHTYEVAGSYAVTATFTLADGTTTSMDKVVQVFTAEAVEVGFEGTITDTSDIVNTVSLRGDVRLEEGRFGEALRLAESKARVDIDRSEEIIDNPAFSISLAFQKDGGTATNDDNGMLVYFSRSAYISTKDGELKVGGVTSTGSRIRLEVETDAIEDGGWHHMAYTYLAETGTAALYLDGVQVDQQTGLTGIQATTTGHDMLLGGRSGGSFGGLMDEVKFTRAALTAQEVEAQYLSLFEGQASVVVEAPAPEDIADMRPISVPEPMAPDDTGDDTPQGPVGADDDAPGDAQVPDADVTPDADDIAQDAVDDLLGLPAAEELVVPIEMLPLNLPAPPLNLPPADVPAPVLGLQLMLSPDDFGL